MKFLENYIDKGETIAGRAYHNLVCLCAVTYIPQSNYYCCYVWCISFREDDTKTTFL